jgi:hypothetical protein
VTAGDPRTPERLDRLSLRGTGSADALPTLTAAAHAIGRHRVTPVAARHEPRGTF